MGVRQGNGMPRVRTGSFQITHYAGCSQQAGQSVALDTRIGQPVALSWRAWNAEPPPTSFLHCSVLSSLCCASVSRMDSLAFPGRLSGLWQRESLMPSRKMQQGILAKHEKASLPHRFTCLVQELALDPARPPRGTFFIGTAVLWLD